jgi:glycosyltransferase involved in cell wall biosynthesis
MRIVQLVTGTPLFGGSDAHVRDLSIGLRARGHECIVMAGPPEGQLAEQLRRNGVTVRTIPALRKPIRPFADAISLFQVIRALREVQPDIVATHTAKAGFIGRIAARAMGVPVFFTPHGLSFFDRKSGDLIGFRLLLEQMAARVGGEMIAVCDAERNTALRYLGSTGIRISTIRNGLPDCETRVEKSRGAVVITMIARFVRQKDHSTLVRALSTLNHLEWELRLAGTGPLLESIQQLVEECGLTPRVSFMHECHDTPRLLAESDIYVLSSNYEAFPISILEAMRAGIPVVATDTGGVREAVQDEVNGFLVPPRDVIRLAERLSSLIRSAELRERMGFQSRRRFTQEFEWRSMLDKTEALYANTLRNKTNCEMAPSR